MFTHLLTNMTHTAAVSANSNETALTIAATSPAANDVGSA